MCQLWGELKMPFNAQDTPGGKWHQTILQPKELRHGEAKWLVQGHKTYQDSNPRLSGSKSYVRPITSG